MESGSKVVMGYSIPATSDSNKDVGKKKQKTREVDFLWSTLSEINNNNGMSRDKNDHMSKNYENHTYSLC